jgi:hypothetical protein
MTSDDILDRMGSLQGLRRTGDPTFPWEDAEKGIPIHVSAGVPRYLTDMGAVLRVFNSLEDNKRKVAIRFLIQDLGINLDPDKALLVPTILDLLEVEPKLWCAAILKASNLWIAPTEGKLEDYTR